jgi:hypothetical protein
LQTAKQPLQNAKQKYSLKEKNYSRVRKSDEVVGKCHGGEVGSYGFMTLGNKGVAWGDGAVTWSDTGYKENI